MIKLIGIQYKKETNTGLELYALNTTNENTGIIVEIDNTSSTPVTLTLYLNIHSIVEHRIYTLVDNKLSREIYTITESSQLNTNFNVTLRPTETKIGIIANDGFRKQKTLIIKDIKIHFNDVHHSSLPITPRISHPPISNYLDAIYYINMKERPNRKIHIIHELIKLGIPKQLVVEIEAVSLATNPQIGCALSHMKALSHATKQEHETILILEDDFTFRVDQVTFIKKLHELNKHQPDWDICMLSSANSRTDNTTHPNIKKVVKADTTAGYLIKNRVIHLLFNIFYQCTKPKIGYCTNQSAIDVAWQILQPKLNWFMFEPQLGHQCEQFKSDIEVFRVNQYNM